MSDLEKKFSDFEESINRPSGKASGNSERSFSTERTSTASSSSYTLILIKMVSSLLDYLRDTHNELSYEKMKQVELNKQLDIHRKLIDGLTTEIMIVKDQNQKILNDYVNQNARIETELDQVKVTNKTL